jgi:hypothetical protein
MTPAGETETTLVIPPEVKVILPEALGPPSGEKVIWLLVIVGSKVTVTVLGIE